MRWPSVTTALICASVLLLAGCASSAAGDGVVGTASAASVESAVSAVNEALQDGGSDDADASSEDDVTDESDNTDADSDMTVPDADTAESATDPVAVPDDFCAAVSAAEFETIFGVAVETTEVAVAAGAQLGGCNLTSAFDAEKPMTMAMVAARSDDFDELVSFYSEGGRSVTVTGAGDAWFSPTTGVLVRGDGGVASYQFMGNPDLMSGAIADETASIAVAEAFLN